MGLNAIHLTSLIRKLKYLINNSGRIKHCSYTNISALLIET